MVGTEIFELKIQRLPVLEYFFLIILFDLNENLHDSLEPQEEIFYFIDGKGNNHKGQNR